MRLTKGAQAIETRLEIGLDRRAPFNVAERREQFEAAMSAHALFGEMSDLVGRIEAARAAAARTPPLLEKLEAIKKKIVATKEGGAITGEERLREYTDRVYGALLSWEGKPAQYLVDRTQVLRRELNDVKAEFEALAPQIHAQQ